MLFDEFRRSFDRLLEGQLLRLYRNPFYAQAYEFLRAESTRLREILEEVNWHPSTPEQRIAIKRQRDRLNKTRLVLRRCREMALSEPDGSSQRESQNMAGGSVGA